jgi:hypothetical protein
MCGQVPDRCAVSDDHCPPAGAVVRLKTVSFIDRQGIGTEAFKLLVPGGWLYEGGLQWVLDNPTMPATSQLRVWNPASAEQFQAFPNQAIFWTANPMLTAFFPAGSKYYGNEVREPAEPVADLKEIAIPRFRAVAQDLKIVSEQDISSILPSSGTPQTGLQTSSGAGKLRIEYTENGKKVEEEIYCVVEVTYIPV